MWEGLHQKMGTLSWYLGVHEYDGYALTGQKGLPENGSEPCLTEAKGKLI